MSAAIRSRSTTDNYAFDSDRCGSHQAMTSATPAPAPSPICAVSVYLAVYVDLYAQTGMLLGCCLQDVLGRVGVADGGLVVEAEHVGQVQWVRASGDGLIELAVHTQPFQGGRLVRVGPG
ncbi:hypothetical protein [Dactylosporangium sp. CA-233914]|uniref:hypothetical protein n=1 Tax=Dactylosporangium sp. CA-233914 TaxID=3239934 RepID=UPI003D932BEA